MIVWSRGGTDSGASNHMTSDKEVFSELDGGVTGSLKFGDGSKVEICGCGTIIFRCQNGEHCVLTDVYYTLSSERASQHRVVRRARLQGPRQQQHSAYRDRERQLLAKVQHSRNHLYMLDLKVEQRPRSHCLLWASHLRHARADVRGLPHIKHVDELCDQLPIWKAKEAAVSQGGQVWH